ncbi:MAG: hypothetical protein ACYTGB_16135 [Planctomycetota bacterium]
MRYLCVAFALGLLVTAGCGQKKESSARKSMALSGTTGAPSRADLGKADRLFNQGVDFYKKGRPGTPNSNANLQKAAKHFREAQGIYEQAAKQDPDNKKIQNRLQDCNRFIYSCMKMQTL